MARKHKMAQKFHSFTVYTKGRERVLGSISAETYELAVKSAKERYGSNIEVGFN